MRQFERNHQRLLDTANEGILKIGPDCNLAYVNTRLADLLGYRPADMIGRPASSFIAEEDQQDYFEKLEMCRNGFPGRSERRLRHKDGHTVHALLSSTPIMDDMQNFQGAFGLAIDTTGRKKAEEQLLLKIQELEERLALSSAALEAARRDLDGRKPAAA